MGSSVEERDQPGPYKWLILLSGFSIQLTASGIMYCVGVFYVIFKENLQGSSTIISLASSLNMCCTFCIGPVAGFMAQKFGNRSVAIGGSIMATVGLILSSMVTSGWQLCLTFGVLTGTGIGLSYIPSISTVSSYFGKHRPIAMGMAAAGLGCGPIIFPPLIQYFLWQYGWRGAMLMVSGIYLHTMVFAAFLKPIEVLKPDKKEKIPDMPAECAKSNENCNKMLLVQSQSGKCDTSDEHYNSKLLIQNVHYKISTCNITKENECLETDHEGACYSTTSDDIDDVDPQAKCSFDLLANVHFNLFLIQCLLFSIGASILYVHLGAYAVSLGTSEDNAALLFLMLGIASTISRVVYGLLAQVEAIGPVRLYVLAQSICGVCVILYPFGHTFIHLSVSAISIGLFYGSFGSLPPLVTVQLVGAEHIGPGYGYVCLSCAIGYVVGGPCAGWLYDSTKYYPSSFFIGGAIMAISVIFLIPVYYIYVHRSRKDNSPLNKI